MLYERANLPSREPEERLKDWDEVAETEDPETRKELVNTQSARCMNCGTPFCHSTDYGCPLSNKIPVFNDYVYQGKWRAALKVVSQLSLRLFSRPIPFQSLLDACVLHLARARAFLA